MNLPNHVNLVEVGPRDGLQNEAHAIPTPIKIEFINRLSKTGLKNIEATSFVSPLWVPQMADSSEVLTGIEQVAGISYSALVPNELGLSKAIAAKAKHIAVFTAASQTFCQKNINCSIEESLERFAKIIQKAHQLQMKVRGYVSCSFGCPYEGEIDPAMVAKVAAQLIQLGCYEVALGDTIGVSTPKQAIVVINQVTEKMNKKQIAVHFHDTYGQALANIYASLQNGITTIDSSVAGLGGCPYAPSASGNVATEDVVYMLNGLGIDSGVDIHLLSEVGQFICNQLRIHNRSKAAVALLSKPQTA